MYCGCQLPRLITAFTTLKGQNSDVKVQVIRERHDPQFTECVQEQLAGSSMRGRDTRERTSQTVLSAAVRGHSAGYILTQFSAAIPWVFLPARGALFAAFPGLGHK